MKTDKYEAKVVQDFQNELKKFYPNAFIYKIPDGESGGKRPFDMIIQVWGLSICIEFKRGPKDFLTAWQALHLWKAKVNGSYTFVAHGENWREKLLEVRALILKEGRNISWEEAPKLVQGGNK